jgi:hypothetical protein
MKKKEEEVQLCVNSVKKYEHSESSSELAPRKKSAFSLQSIPSRPLPVSIAEPSQKRCPPENLFASHQHPSSASPAAVLAAAAAADGC